MRIGERMGQRHRQKKSNNGMLIFGCLFLVTSSLNASAMTVKNFDGIKFETNRNVSGVKKFQWPHTNTSTLNSGGRVLHLAQSSDADVRVIQLEEDLRRLNGQLEELNFQLLQMQEQMRRMQEDNEYRFQELEDGKQGGLDQSEPKIASKQTSKQKKGNAQPGKPIPSRSADANSNLDGERKIVKSAKSAKSAKSVTKKRMIDGVEIYEGTGDELPRDGAEAPLGTITFDSLGNVVDSALGKPLDLTARRPNSNLDDEFATEVDLASIGSARQLYELGYEYFQNGDYSNSERAFAEFVDRYPENAKIANAQFWLGESMFSQANFEGAAKVFLDAHTNWPEVRIAPQMLLKLGISLIGMRQRELACATYAKVIRKYPNMSNTVRRRVADEQKSAQCLNS